MCDDISRWVDDGIAVVLVGNGTAAFAEAFREDFEFQGELFVDPDLIGYRAAGLRRGASPIAWPRLLADLLQAC